jgi:hypothetical protein
MSVKAKIEEIKSIKKTLSEMRVRAKKLRSRIKELEKGINTYLEHKDQRGVKYKGTAVTREAKMKRKFKKKLEREEDSYQVLINYGIRSPKRVLKELDDAKREDPIEHFSIKYTKLKN